MNQKSWESLCADTVTKMSQHVQKFTTPISKVIKTESEEYGRHQGSGSYYEHNGERFIISNEHVLYEMNSHTLTYKFQDRDDIFKLNNIPKLHKKPIDIGVVKIDNEIWDTYSNNSSAIPIDRFALKHEPQNNELLFFLGYSAKKSEFYYNTLLNTGTPYATQESVVFPDNVEEADSKYHFSLFYLPDKAVSLDSKSYLPDPHGFSGSLVWDTKLVQCLQQDISWKPEYAVVTGILWGWPSSSGCVLATKIEHFRDNLFM